MDKNARNFGTDDNQNNRESKGRPENKTIFAPKYIIHNVYVLHTLWTKKADHRTEEDTCSTSN